ncbi:Hpt domain-containing protein [Massilia sp. MB5]|uniref:Hpt domain-containing protein n=1 Tax=unclassified Massilia TaxID=2609279 RepID=UPI00067D101C|nr:MULTISPECIES: Hpt domain-containing protein [unclassified Massilia]AKU23532.1 hypothetical protein ACZ75_20810 [Massilia sp. NR 4-1]UMR31552.1 Hpt domain-containing protein [Massilia sp. MB5]
MNDSAPATPRSALDLDDGLQRLMGDRPLLQRLLQRFRHDYRDAAQEAGALLAAGAAEDARRKVHTLKGAAGMVGAHEVHDLARQIEQQLDAPALHRLDEAMRRLLHKLDGVLPPPASAPPLPAPGPADPAAQRALLNRLALLLDEGNGAAIDLLEQSAAPLIAALGIATYQEIAEAAHEFDFELALATLLPLL